MGQENSSFQKIYSKEIENTGKPGETNIFVHPESPFYINTDKNTVYKTVLASSSMYSHQICLGKFSHHQSQYIWRSYSHIFEYALKIGYGLCNLDLSTPLHSQPFIGIYSKNRPEWLISDIACMSQNIVTIPLYEKQQIETLALILNETQMKALFISRKLLKNIIQLAQTVSLKYLKVIIQYEKVNEEEIKIMSDLGLEIYSMKELAKINEEGKVKEPRPNDWFTICYTSGTTGTPKGAIISHSNMTSAMIGIFHSGFFIHHDDFYLSYLPLAHMMERILCYLLLANGGAIGFSSGDITDLNKDLMNLKPTIFVSVPRIFKRFYELILKNFEETSGLKKKIIEKALSVKLENYEKKQKITHKIWDKIVFKKCRELIGGKVRMIVTGSAPISGKILKHLRIFFSCPIIEGYGQTEACAGSFKTNALDLTTDHIGGPIINIEAKLVDDRDMGYFTSNLGTTEPFRPRGEICIRGPSVFQGYFNDHQLTSLVIDEEKWLHTGDIAEYCAENHSFKIIDRKSNCFKLAQGEFVASEKIEKVYHHSKFINHIFVYGNSFQNYLIGIVVPNEKYLREILVRENEIYSQMSLKEICKNPEVKEKIFKDMEKIAKEFRLMGFEIVKKIYLEPNDWIREGFLTPTFKLKRHLVKLKYQEIIEGLYVEN